MLSRTIGARLPALMLFALLLPAAANAQSAPEFAGIPTVKISEGGTERVPVTIERRDGVNLSCIISKIDGKYYWASRENKPLVRVQSGAFITFIALNGSGYVRVISPEAASAARLMGGAEAEFDYVEHLLIGLRSVTYYGKRR